MNADCDAKEECQSGICTCIAGTIAYRDGPCIGNVTTTKMYLRQTLYINSVYVLILVLIIRELEQPLSRYLVHNRWDEEILNDVH